MNCFSEEVPGCFVCHVFVAIIRRGAEEPALQRFLAPTATPVALDFYKSAPAATAAAGNGGAGGSGSGGGGSLTQTAGSSTATAAESGGDARGAGSSRAPVAATDHRSGGAGPAGSTEPVAPQLRPLAPAPAPEVLKLEEAMGTDGGQHVELLQAMKLSRLQARAVSTASITLAAVEAALDADNPKQAMIKLLLGHQHRQPPHPGQAVGAEQPAAAAAASTKAATAAADTAAAAAAEIAGLANDAATEDEQQSPLPTVSSPASPTHSEFLAARRKLLATLSSPLASEESYS